MFRRVLARWIMAVISMCFFQINENFDAAAVVFWFPELSFGFCIRGFPFWRLRGTLGRMGAAERTPSGPESDFIDLGWISGSIVSCHS